MLKVCSVILACVFLVGCGGVVDRVTTSVGGMKVEQVETADLTCAVAQFGGSVSIDCIEKK